MKQRLQSLAISIIMLFGVGAVAILPTVAVSADSKADACQAIGGCADNQNGSVSVSHIVQLVINILSFIVGIAAVIMIIVAGLKFITANGNASNVASARSALMYALIGLFIVASAQTLVRYVLAKAK